MSLAGNRALEASKQSQHNFQHLYSSLWKDKLRHQFVHPSRKRIPRWTPPKDRVAAYNVEPGDQVLVRRGQFKGKDGVVLAVDRPNNRLYLEGEEFSVQSLSSDTSIRGNVFRPDFRTRKTLDPIPIAYSNVALVVPSKSLAKITSETSDPNELPPWRKFFQNFPRSLTKPSTPETQERESHLIIVATRLKSTNLRFNSRTKRFEWDRQPLKLKLFNLRTKKFLNDSFKELPLNVKGTTAVLWNSQISRLVDGVARKNTKEILTAYDNTNDAAFAESFRALEQPWHRLTPELSVPYSEFGNIHSRARRQTRWNLHNRDPRTFKILKDPTRNWPHKLLAEVDWKRVRAETAAAKALNPTAKESLFTIAEAESDMQEAPSTAAVDCTVVSDTPTSTLDEKTDATAASAEQVKTL